MDEHNVARTHSGRSLGFVSRNIALRNGVGDLIGIISPSYVPLDLEGEKMEGCVLSEHGTVFDADGNFKSQAVGVPPPMGLLKDGGVDAGLVLWAGGKVRSLRPAARSHFPKQIKN